MVEILRFEPESGRTAELFRALTHAAPMQRVSVRRSTVYEGRSKMLMLWGPGAPERQAVMRKHVDGGGHCFAWDLAYWDRERKFRCSIDAAHPSAWVMRKDRPESRLKSDRVPVRDAWKPNGPIVIAGLGDKARVQYGASTVDTWERSMINGCRDRWPNRPILYRKKKAGSPVPDDVNLASMQAIDQVLAHASLVITWHSNVAVDAIRLGIPVICKDGAAAAVCPSELGPDDPRPLPVDVRDRFLRNLAWFQWGTTPSEARGFWTFMREVLQ